MRITRLLLILLLAFPLMAQRERQIAPPDESEKNFFLQLRNVFGKFQEGDLRRSFQNAQAVKCSTLVSDTGEWRPVAFFNEDPKLGAGYHRSLEEVKREVDLYTFKGACGKEDADVQLVTKYPVRDSLDKYAAARIPLSEVDVNVNAPVTAKYNPRSQGYFFELPYLYSVQGPPGSRDVFSLRPMRATDRYVTHVTNHWDCKSVRSNDVTFQFLICETAVLPRNLPRNSEVTQTFGSYAYLILSDGKEATTSAKLSFGTPGDDEKAPAAPAPDPAPAAPAAPAKDTPGVEGWQTPGPTSKLGEADKTEFRIRFSPQTWAGKATTAQVLSDQKMAAFDAAKPPTGIDYCAWRPTTSSLVARVLGNEPDAEVSYTLTASASPTTISFDMKTHNGTRLGTLQCVFQGANSAIPFERWVAAVGAHLTLEVRP
jgi:hypothetical protein